MTWNYRVVKTHHADERVTYHIHKVHYGNDGSIETWTEEPVAPVGGEVGELREDIVLFSRAFRHPVLEQRESDGNPALRADVVDAVAINSGHYWELLDRAYVASAYVDEFLGNHPLLKKEGALHTAYERASEALAELYLHAGELACDKGA